MPGDVGVDGDGEYEVVVLAIAVVELVAPDVFDVAGVDEAVAVRRGLDEHHRRQVVEVPARGDLHESRLLPLRQRLHPRLRLLPVVDAVPRVADAQIIRLAVVMAHAVVVFNAVVQQELAPFLTTFPPTMQEDPINKAGPRPRISGGEDNSPRRHASARPLTTTEFGEHAVRLVEDVSLLLEGHLLGVLVGVAVEADLMPGVAHSRHLLGERLQAVARDEPRGLHRILVEQLQETAHPHRAREYTPAHVARRILAPVGPQPAGNGVHIHTVGYLYLLLSHCASVTSWASVLVFTRVGM